MEASPAYGSSPAAAALDEGVALACAPTPVGALPPVTQIDLGL